MTKAQMKKVLNELVQRLEDFKGDIECRKEILDNLDNPTDRQDEENEALNDLEELINEVVEKMEEITTI